MGKTVTMAELAEALDVSRQQVATWYRRRANNGFPEPKSETLLNGYKYVERLWDLDEATSWHQQYAPSKGGRPRQTG